MPGPGGRVAVASGLGGAGAGHGVAEDLVVVEGQAVRVVEHGGGVVHGEARTRGAAGVPNNSFRISFNVCPALLSPSTISPM